MRIIRVRKYGKHHSYIITDAKAYILSGVIFGLMAIWGWLNTPPPRWHSPYVPGVRALEIMPTPIPTATPTPTPAMRKAKVTAYSCNGITNEAERLMNCPNGVTSSGTIPTAGRTVACDRSMLGKTVFLEGIGVRHCEDTGGAILGDNIDLYVDNLTEAYQFGVRYINFREVK